MTSAVQEQEPIWKRVYDAINLQDHTNIRDPYGLSTLGQRWQDKTIGKEWREGQMADVWDLLPDEWKPGVAEWGKGMAEKFGTAWMDARTLEGKEWLDPGKIAAAGTARTLEAIGIPFELLAQGVTQVTGLDIELSRIASDFIPVGAGISKLSKIARQSRLAKRVSQLQNLAPNELAYLQSQANKIKQITQPGGKWRFVEDATGIPSISGAEEAGLLMRVTQNLDDYSDFGWVKGLEDLDPAGPIKIRAKGETKRKLASQHTTGVEVTPQMYKAFKESSSNALEAYESKLGAKVGLVEDHHKGLIRQIFESTNGLLPHARQKGADFISKGLGFELGYAGRNAVPLPTKFHPRIHALINKRIAEGGYLGGYNLRGIEKKLNLPKDWQSTFSHTQRIPIYKEIISTIGDSVKQIDVFWDSLVSRTNLGALSKEEYLTTVLDVIDLDKRLLDVKNPSVMSAVGTGGTATEIINDILTKAGKIDMTSPIFNSLDAPLSKEALKLALQENGYLVLWEVIISGKTPATVFKAYGIKPSNKLIKAIQKDNAAYQHMLRSRNRNIPPADSAWNFGQDN